MSLATLSLGHGGPRIAFLHGLFGQGRNWAQIAKGVCGEDGTGARALLVDLPDHGRSPWTPSGAAFSFEAYAAAVADTFHGEHRQLYGYDFRGDPTQQVEWVNLRVTGIGPITRPELHPIAAAEGELADRAVTDHRDVCFEAEHGYVRTPVIDRARLGAGDAFSGPAIVEEFGSTIPVHPGFDVRVDDYGNLVIRKEGSR